MLRKARSAVVSMVFILGLNTTAFAAASFKDVSSTHWAYSSIIKMADSGIIVGDSSGNYKPDQALDKFSTAKMLARVAGYKYINISDAEQQYYDKAYKANEFTLSLYRKAFTKWDSTADKEIAFLLEKEVLTVDDLNQFVLKMTDGTEKLRGLNREEVSIFLVKLMDKRNEAVTTNYTSKFDDDSSISVNARPYVNYLKHVGIVSGGNDNKFNPKNAVTKAAMAVLLDKTVSLMNSLTNSQTSIPSYNSSSSASASGNSGSISNSQSATIDSISGKIDKVYPSLNAIQVLTSDDKRNIWKLTQNANIYIDGFNKTLNDVKEGMSINAVISNNDIVELHAQSLTTGTIIDTGTNQHLSTLEGIVSYVSGDAAAQIIGVEIKVMSPTGDINSVISSYALTPDCKITRGSQVEEFNNINAGDIIKGQVSGSKIHSIKLVEKNLALKGKLIEKKYVESTATVYLRIEDTLKEKYDFKVTDSSVISRNSYGAVKWNELRIGDDVDLTAEYDKLTTLHATGNKSTKEGIVEEIHLTRQNASIVLKDSSTSVLTTYEIIPEAVDVYVLKIGSKIKVSLDSQEVEKINIIEETPNTAITGYIQNIRSNSITVSSSLNSSTGARQFTYDKDTVIIDGITGGKISSNFLEQDMQVYVTVSASDTSYAKIITVLRYVD